MSRPVRLAVLVASLCLAVPVRGGEPPAPDPVGDALAKLKSYDFTQPRAPLTFLELHVSQCTKDPAASRTMAERLAAILADAQATDAAKTFVCKQLLQVGTEAQVPLLVKMLEDPKTAEMARRTLEGIPGEASLKGLRVALARLKGKPLVGAINSLGIRRDAESAGALAKLLSSSDQAIADAAAEALGKIGTAEAAAALLKAMFPAKSLFVLHDAQLRCAENLAAAGDNAAAAAIYEPIWKSDRRPAQCLAGLAGLARTDKAKAAPLVLDALTSEDPLFQATALRLTRQLPGKEITGALVERLAKLDSSGQALLLGVLADRSDRSAAPPVAKLIEAQDEVVRVAAIRAMGSLGDASTIDLLAKLAATQGGNVQAAARESLARLAGPGVDERVLAAAAKGEPAVRSELIRATATRRIAAATPILLKAATDADQGIRRAAFDALAATGQPDGYQKLLELLVAAPTPSDAEGAERAALAVGGRIAERPERLGPMLAALKTAPAKAKPPLLRLLGGCGCATALDTVRTHLGDPDDAVRDTAVRVLANWADASPADDLLKLAREAKNTTHRVLALRGYLRMAGETTDAATRLKMLEQVRQIATTADAKKMLLGSLGNVGDAAAMQVAASFLGDPQVEAEAAAAMLSIGRALLSSDRKAVVEGMKTLIEKTKDDAVIKQADALHAEALRPPPRGGSASMPPYDKKRSDAMRADVAKRAPKGYQVVCYLNCGPDSKDGAEGKPTLRHASGQAYKWGDGDDRYGTIFYTGDDVVFEATGLSPKKAYQLGFSWWDCDHDTRVQSVWVVSGKGKPTKLLGATKLPSGAKGQKPEEKALSIPRELTASGTARITFRNEAQPNCVVSEIWLLESEAEGAQGEPGAKGAAREGEAPAEPNGGGQPATKVLIVTGVDSAHNWRATAPVLADVLKKDPRLSVRVVDDPNFLASDELKDYDVVVIHFQNPKPLPKGVEGGKNLQKLVEGGTGLVVIHFGCGALREWPDFVKLAGRVWDPKLRAHDPRGPFKVDITDVKHPITEGMQTFDTDDELYTCLAGDVPIQVLATAISKVDKKVYPMAFVLTVGKGRVFNTVLGHDPKAMTFPGVAELFRRGTAWAAGLPPVAESAEK